MIRKNLGVAQKWHGGTEPDCTYSEAMVELGSLGSLDPAPPTSERVQFHVWNLKRERMLRLSSGPWKPDGVLLDGAGIYVDILSAKHQDHVYFVECPSLSRIKIGVTIDVATRVKEIASTSPTGDIRLLISIPVERPTEKRFHKAFEIHRIHGEWFHFAPEIQLCIDHLRRLLDAR